MTRIIHTQHGSQERRQMLKMLLCMTDLLQLQQIEANELADMAAFALLTLENIRQSIEKSTSAWEKRGYWIKADQFRKEWKWMEGYIIELRQSFQLHRSHESFKPLLRNLNQAIKTQGISCDRMSKDRFWLGARHKLSIK